MNVSTWINGKIVLVDVPEPKKTLSKETESLNGALKDLTETLKEVNKRHGTAQVFGDAMDAMKKEYRK